MSTEIDVEHPVAHIHTCKGWGGTSVRPVFRGGLRLTSLEGGPRTLDRPH